MKILAVITLLLMLIPISYAEDLASLVKVVRVVDGDTIIVRGVEGFNKGEEFRVRFADINAPELSTPEGKVSKGYLESILKDRDILLLDIDDKYIYDRYGRVVAVVYIINEESGSYNLMNLNEHLVREGYAAYNDYDNAFNYKVWVYQMDCNDTDVLRCIPDLPIPIIALCIGVASSILIKRII